MIERIMIIGGAGSGKSSLARRLGEITGLPVIHIDTLYWQPGWIMRPRDEIGRLTNEAADQDTWIFEGNHSETMIYRASRADTRFSRYIDRASPVACIQKNHNPLRTLTPGYGGRLCGAFRLGLPEMGGRLSQERSHSRTGLSGRCASASRQASFAQPS